MAVGRHRGLTGVLYGRKRARDARGNLVTVPDLERPYRCRMSMKQIRANRGAAKGQLTNEVALILVEPRTVDGELLTDVGAWTLIEFDGKQWDAAAPPALKRGTRRTTHWEFECRPRPPSNLAGIGGGVDGNHAGD